MKDIQFDAGTLLAADDDKLELTYALVPHGEKCRSNLGVFEVDHGGFELPEDLTGMAVNLDHKREHPVAAFARLEDQPDTLVAAFRFSKTKAGRAAYADAKDPNGKRRFVSVEARDVIIKAGKAVSGAVFGAALVDAPAFPSATLLAAAADTPDPETPAPETPAPEDGEPVVTTDHAESEHVDEAGVTVHRTEDVETETETDPETGSVKTTTTTTVVEESTPGETPAPNEEAGPVPVPNTLDAGKAPATTKQRPADLRTLFAAMNRAKVRMETDADRTLLAATSRVLGGSPEQIATTLNAELANITISGANSLPVGGEAIQPNWINQLESGQTYERMYVPLAKTGTDITAEGKKGYRVKRGTAASPVDSYADEGDWAGNKADIGTGTGFTDPATSTLHRFAFGADVAREYYDLPGGADVLAAFFALIREDHLVWSDEKARLAWIALAGAPLALATYPTEFPASLGVVMQALLEVRKPKADKRRDRASFVIINDEAAEQIAYTPFEHIPNYVKFAWDLDGEGLVDGDVVLVNGDNGITGSPAALAGARYALELDELAGGPLWVDALHIAQGGIDKAIHGYLQEFKVREEAVKLVGVPETRANSTAYPLGRLIKVSSVYYRVVVAGTSAGSAPTAPAVGATVADGSATLLRLV